VAVIFLYPCEPAMFSPFATFLIESGLFGILHGLFLLPALVCLYSPETVNKLKSKNKSV
jgi:hypothetical protein